MYNLATINLEGYYEICEDTDRSTLNPAEISNLIPTTLYPTTLQSTRLHRPYVDLFPHAGVRNNLIMAEGQYDEDELACDLLGEVIYEDSFTKTERNGLIVWGEPWDPYGWEVMEGFVRKWGWLLKGCEDLIAASNRWRALRDEEPLFLVW